MHLFAKDLLPKDTERLKVKGMWKILTKRKITMLRSDKID